MVVLSYLVGVLSNILIGVETMKTAQGCPNDCSCHGNPTGTKYYVSVIRDGGDYRLLVGPLPFHSSALLWVDRASSIARALDPKSVWYRFGTCAVKGAVAKPNGILNSQMGDDFDRWLVAHTQAQKR